MYRYKELADEIASRIEDRTYEVGQRLPSVRNLSRSLGVSVTTVLGAYRGLEDRGLILAKPRSGYFVASPHEGDEKIQRDTALRAPREVPFAGLMQTLLAETGQADLLRLGLAHPEPEVLPIKTLHRTWRRVLRTPLLRTSDYLNPRGLLALRQAIATLMAGRGVSVSAAEVLVTNGCQQALRIALECVAKSGDIIAVESPCYPGFLHIAAALGIKVLEIPIRARSGIDLDLLTRAVEQHGASVIFITSTCSNPSGATVPVDKRKALAALAERNNAIIIEDDTNSDLYYGPDFASSIKTFDRGSNVLYCNSFSKTLGPGMRLGWLIPGQFMEKALAKRYIDDLSGPSVEQYVLSQFVGSSEYRRALERAKRVHARTATEMVRGIRHSFPSGTSVTMPTGGFLLWVQLPNGVDGDTLREKAMEKRISVAPGSLFSASDQYCNHVRIGWGGLWNDTLAEALATLGNVVSSLANE
jgi:DNA-binding transcriptional MocR family regulator